MTQTRLRPGEVAVITAAGLLLVVVAPPVSAMYWTPKVVVALALLGPGLVALGLAVADGDRAAAAGATFVAVAAVATWWSPARALSVLGLYNNGAGLLLIALLVGTWAIGRRLSDRGAWWLGTVVIVGAALNAVMAWLQMSRISNASALSLIEGRTPALLGNPVQVAALMAGAFALVGERWIRLPAIEDPERARAARLLLALAALLVASAVQFSGGRAGLVLLVVVLVRVVLAAGPRRAVPLLACLALGVVAAIALQSGSQGAASRVAADSGGALSGRIDRWQLGLDAIRERPVLGLGPGLYRRATSPFDTPAAARAYGPDALNADAHNVFVEYGATTGLVGLAAFTLWLVLAGRRARGELVWLAAIGGFSLLLQPLWVGVTPVLALALGAAARRAPPPVPRGAGVTAVALVVVGAVAGGLLVRGDATLSTAVLDHDVAAARRATDQLPVWPEAPLAEARAAEYRARQGHDPRDWRIAVAAAATAQRRDPSDPTIANVRGRIQLELGHLTAADRAFRHALVWNPQSLEALSAAAGIARAQDRPARVRALCRRARRVRPELACPVPLPPTAVGATRPSRAGPALRPHRSRPRR